MRRCIVFLGFAAGATGCAGMAASLAGPARFEAQYEVELASVQRPAKARDRYGEQKISTLADSAVTKYSFEDKLVRVITYAARDRVVFNIENRTDNVIRLPWNEAAVVDIDGKSQQVMHAGVKFTDCSSPKAPSIIAPHGLLEDGAIPCPNVRFSYSSWSIEDLVSGGLVQAKDTLLLAALARGNVGKELRLLLPLQIEDVVNDYVFTFKVKSQRLVRWSAAAYLARQP